MCSCESSRKDLQSKQGRRVPEQGGARLIFRCDAEARITKRGEAGCSCALSRLQEQADRRIQRRSQESRNLPHCLGITRSKRDRKSTRLNSSHTVISYAVFCLKKKNKSNINTYVTN